ncbi:MAG: hypothetical protein KA419_20075 [Acidobacteria bacterium]|nr:hypothetical protein [Acidobacteriota bacterium]
MSEQAEQVGGRAAGERKPVAGRKARRLFFSLMIGSVVLSGLLGIGALVIGRFDDIQARVLLTSLAITAGCIGILAGVVAVERGWAAFGKAAAGQALAATAGLVFAVWAGEKSETLWQVVATLWAFSAASGLVCLTVFVRPAPRYRWALGVYRANCFTLAALVSAMAWSRAFQTEEVGRALGVLSIVAAALTILLCILHRLNAEAARPTGAPPGAPVRLLCPACGHEVVHPLGTIQCPDCGCHFEFRVLSKH